MKRSKLTTRDLVLMALYGSLFIATELIQNQLSLFKMPEGGSLGISSIILLLSSYHLGLKKGVTISLISVALQFITGQMYLGTGFIGFFLDYILGFGIYGIAVIFPNFGYLYTGVIVTNMVRLLGSTISGVLFYEFPFKGSLLYNATYMVPTLIVGLLLVPLIFRRLKDTNLID